MSGRYYTEEEMCAPPYHSEGGQKEVYIPDNTCCGQPPWYCECLASCVFCREEMHCDDECPCEDAEEAKAAQDSKGE